MAVPEGLAWSWELDFDALMAALDRGGRPDHPDAGEDAADAASGGDRAVAGQDGEASQEAVLEELLATEDAGRMRTLSPDEVAGRVAERLPAGPALAALLAGITAREARYRDLPALAAGYRRLAAWAQAGELAAVAQIASTAAARDHKIDVDADGRPAQISPSAAGEVALALVMSQFGAECWADLAVTLTWRLAATGAALAAGDIDLVRARLIAEATSVLDDDAARAVEGRVLCEAGTVTTGRLRALLRRAVIAADPEGAERRREQAETRARVGLYPDDQGTATVCGSNLPALSAAAAMARIAAIARAWKSAGAGGTSDLLRAKVFLGLLLGTLPYIPPPEGAPPDPPVGRPPGNTGPEGCGPHGPRPGNPGRQPPDGRGPEDSGSAHPGREDSGSGDTCPGNYGGQPTDGQVPEDSGPGEPRSGDLWPKDGGRADGWDPDDPGPGDQDAPPKHGDPADGWDPDDPGPGDQDAPPKHGDPADGWDPDDPGPGDQDAPPDDAHGDAHGEWMPADTHDDEEDRPGVIAPAWPALPACIPAGFAASGAARPPGLLDLTLSWSALTGTAADPAHLGRIGPITATQARQLALLAAAGPAAEWRVILTNTAGQAIEVTRIPRPRTRAGPADQRAGPVGLVGRVTVVVTEDLLGPVPPSADHAPAGILAAIWRAATRGGAAAAARAEADRAASGCAHTGSTPAYRPGPALRDLVTARDRTCRFPPCRQPAWRADLDHTIPHHKGGRTCSCNLGGDCRTHHKIKQLHGWGLRQMRPGEFQWTTPAGRTYTITPDSYTL